jgi:hypothetical protein
MVVTWWSFAKSGVLLALAVVLLSATLADANPAILSLATAIGLLASVLHLTFGVIGPVLSPLFVTGSRESSEHPNPGDGTSPVRSSRWRTSVGLCGY